MKQNINQLSSQETEAASAHQMTHGQQAIRQFESVEDLLRHDAAQTPPPTGLAERVQQSVAKEPPAPARPWWQRILGR